MTVFLKMISFEIGGYLISFEIEISLFDSIMSIIELKGNKKTQTIQDL